MIESQATSIMKGNYVEALVITRALQLGYKIYKPIFEGSCCDFILEKGKELKRIQVKSSCSDSEKIQIGLTKGTSYKGDPNKNRYSEEEIDAFVSYAAIKQKFIWIPLNEVKGRKQVTLRILNNPRVSGEIFWVDRYWW